MVLFTDNITATSQEQWRVDKLNEEVKQKVVDRIEVGENWATIIFDDGSRLCLG